MGMPRKPVEPGTVFGYLTAIGPGPDLHGKDGVNVTTTVCRCVCGKEITVRNSNLRGGSTKSCGCMTKKMLHASNVKHGERFSRLYKCWDSMKERCFSKSHPSYKDYGGRGITVCAEWLDYVPFSRWAKSNGYRDDLTIDRIDVNGNYCPENCRWVDFKTQANNKRTNRVLEIDGSKRTLQEWADISGNSFALILWRLDAGKPVKNAVFDPPMKKNWSHKQGTHGVMRTAFGHTLNTKQWSELLGVKRTTLGLYLKRGKTIEQFVSDHYLAGKVVSGDWKPTVEECEEARKKVFNDCMEVAEFEAKNRKG